MNKRTGGDAVAGHGGYFIVLLLRIALIGGLVAATNLGAYEHATLLYETKRWGTLIAFLGVWGIAAGALLIGALQPNLSVRALWAGIFALGGAFGYAFHQASGTQFSIFDAVSLWSARHEAGRAFEFYGAHFAGFAAVLTAGFLVLAIAPVRTPPALARALRWCCWVPLVPVLVFAAIMYQKEGGGSRGLPTQFAPFSVVILSAAKIASNSMPERREVAWIPVSPADNTARPVRRIVVLVDESVRGDYIDWTEGNALTPELARRKGQIADFGPAASGGNCSHYSNAILRFMGSRDGLGRSLLTNPTLWRYARKAGYRTVFIDAQAAFIRRMAGYPGKLQNFMTPEEAGEIDSVQAIREDVPAHALDDELLDIVLEELAGDEPVLIYANKNGAHFPYDAGYPPSAARFHPNMAAAPDDDARARINSYRNVIHWSVDRFFKRLFEQAKLDDTVIIYTSDHGQLFGDAQFTQCTVDNPDPRQGLVPLFVAAGDQDLRLAFARAAAASKGHGSHFAIPPTVLRLMGYAQSDIATVYGPSLFEKNEEKPGFTSGDVLGLFSEAVRWNAIDLGRSYLEPEAAAPAESAPASAATARLRGAIN